MQMITMYAMKAGFTGGIVIDYPNSTRVCGSFARLLLNPRNFDCFLEAEKSKVPDLASGLVGGVERVFPHTRSPCKPVRLPVKCGVRAAPRKAG
jgi:hypothetical protein